ncbi:ABC transporter permease subunit [Halosegnis marinus]|uniref:ABC transporter permease subunit n=1 Tax=Halosegnis marinus TaxID=3034023 RepID=UPI00361951E9
MVSQGLLFDQIITGLSIGGRLFLIAVGLSLIFGVLDVLNFAHGVLYMIGAYAALWALGVVSVPFLGALGIGFWPGVVVGLLVAGLIGALIEGVFIRRVYDREPSTNCS